MMNKKRLLMTLSIVAVATTLSLAYIYENSYSSVSVRQSQYMDWAFDDLVELSGIVIVGTVVDQEMVLLPFDVMDKDEFGVDYIVDSRQEPFQKVSLRVDEYLRDTTGKFDNLVVFYEFDTEGIGWKDGERTMFYKAHPQTFDLGEQNIYIITTYGNSDYPGKYTIGAFGQEFYFENINGSKYIQSQADHFFGNDPILYSDALNTIMSINNQTMTSDMIQKHKDYKP